MGLILRGGVAWDKQKPLSATAGFTFSEKLDGHRTVFSGQSYGSGSGSGSGEVLVRDVPWANLVTFGKKKGAQVSSGMWSRYLNRVAMPPSVSEELCLGVAELCDRMRARRGGLFKGPYCEPLLDCEIWVCRGPSGLSKAKSICGVDSWEDRRSGWFPEDRIVTVQESYGDWLAAGQERLAAALQLEGVVGAERVAREIEASPWVEVTAATQVIRARVVVHDIVSPAAFAEPRTGPHDSAIGDSVGDWLRCGSRPNPWDGPYRDRMVWLREVAESRGWPAILAGEDLDYLGASPVCVMLPQVAPPGETWDDCYRRVLTATGEGLMFQSSKALWRPIRDPALVKVKAVEDDVGMVVGVTAGEGELSGLIGALIVDWTFSVDGSQQRGVKRIKIGTGLTREERSRGKDWWVKQIISFGFLGLTEDGWPREPRLVGIVTSEAKGPGDPGAGHGPGVMEYFNL